MEETKRTDESTNGEPAGASIDTPQEASNSCSDSTTIVAPAAEHDGGKTEPNEDTLMEEKLVEPAIESNITVSDPARDSADEPKAGEPKEATSEEVVAVESHLDEPVETPVGSTVEGAELTAEPKTVEKSVEKEVKETVDETKSTEEPEKASAPSKEPPATMEFVAPAPVGQAMDVEDQTAAPVPVAVVSIQEQIAEEQKLETEAVEKIANSSLSMLCQYSGSSDSEAEDTDASNVVGVGSKASSSSSSSSDDSDVEITKETPAMSAGGYRMQDDPILVSDAETMDTNAASSEDEEDEPIKGPIRTAGEILPHELPPIEELTITVPETECKPIGHIESIVAQIVLVQSVAGAELLNLDTVLFLDRGQRALGKIFDVIGQVNQPIYCVLFNSNQEILTKNITTGMEVFCAPRTEYTSFIILSELMRTKGSDASWMNDNEIPSYMAEHSDDEAERAAKRNRKKNAANRQQAGGAQNDDDAGSEMGDEQQQQQHNRNPRQPSPSTSRPQYQRGNGGRQFNPRYPSGTSWHHNYNPRYGQPQQFRPRFPPRNQQFQQQQQHYQHHQHQQYQQQYRQQHQQIPHMQPPPQGMVLPNPFANQGPPRQPPPGPY
uniref:H/ACA ribonucleoprotein complex non-core subunit NAF1 n=2 Tax=Anopheles gambiae TaxID=7165 RepID=A0A1S4H8S8_ANOGA